MHQDTFTQRVTFEQEQKNKKTKLKLRYINKKRKKNTDQGQRLGVTLIAKANKKKIKDDKKSKKKTLKKIINYL